MFNSIEDIKKAGFKGFKTIQELLNDSKVIPNVKGIYMILISSSEKPIFINPGTGPTLYKKKTNPNVNVKELEMNWVDKTIVIYIGKAGGYKDDGTEMDATLKSRLYTYLRFGKGKDVRHYGGRYIWQLENSKKLVVCWKMLPNDDPRSFESNLIQKFNTIYKKRPFANLTGIMHK